MAMKHSNVVTITITAILLSACSTIVMPDIDVPGIPEFKEAAAKLVDGYPDVSKAPVRPEDLRASPEWDSAATALMAQRDGFVVPEKGNMPESPEDIAREIEALKAKVRSYKLDDPQ